MAKRIYPAGISKSMMKLYKFLLNNKGSFLRPHMSHTGAAVCKLMDKDLNPLRIYTKDIVDEMINKKFLTKQDGIIVLAPNGMTEDRPEEEVKRTYSFGKVTDFKKGDIVFCRGEKYDCIGVVQCRAAVENKDDIRFFISPRIETFSYKDMRFAKNKEVDFMKASKKKRFILVAKQKDGE